MSGTEINSFRVAETVTATADFDASLQFWCGLFGLEVLAEAQGLDAGMATLWQVDAELVGRRALLGVPGGLASIHLVEVLLPGKPLREGVGSLDALPKTLNLLVRNLPEVWQRLHNAGAHMKGEWVEYTQDGRSYRDAHVMGPDFANVGLLEVLDEDYPVNELGIGQPASFTFTIEDMAREQAFYQALGGELRLDCFFDGPAIESLVGLPAGGSLEMKLLGPQVTAARLELVSYGVPMPGHYDRACLPATGMLMVHLEGVAADVQARLADHDVRFVQASPWGRVKKMAALTAPSGARLTIAY